MWLSPPLDKSFLSLRRYYYKTCIPFFASVCEKLKGVKAESDIDSIATNFISSCSV